MIQPITSYAALMSLHEQLQVSMEGSFHNKITLLANFMRHACALYCPIPRGKLIQTTTKLLTPIFENANSLHIDLESVLNGLFESGDLLEISRFISSDEKFSGDWIFLAPPSYIQRSSGRIYICGIASDNASILPLSLVEKLQSIGPYRYLPTSCTETISLLESVGLRNVPEHLWFVMPKRQSPDEFLEHALRKLSKAPPAGTLHGVRIFQNNKVKDLQYKDRWIYPHSESGHFVCRRPSVYGAENWSFAELHNGQVIRFIDLPWTGEKLRGCDAGWRLQLAIDSVNQHPATYQKEQYDDKVVVRFSFPIPLWAQRRFQAIDDHLNASPFKRSFPLNEWPAEMNVIENDLWFAPE